MSNSDSKTPEQAAGDGAQAAAARKDCTPDRPSDDDLEAGAESPLVEGEIPAAVEEDPLVKLEAEVASLKDQLLRALAETENVRRRSLREREDTLKYAAAPVIKDLLGVADNLSRALESLPEDLAADERIRPLVEGVRLTEKELTAAFEGNEITKIDPLGERLDPHLHEAMFEVEDPSKPAGTIVQVVQAGYKLHDRLLRAARVGVSKGGAPKGANDNATEPGSHVDTSI